MDNVKVFSKPHPPLLIIHGTKDQIAKYGNAVKLYDAAVQPKMMLTVPDGSHGSYGDKFFDTVAEFLRKYNI